MATHKSKIHGGFVKPSREVRKVEEYSFYKCEDEDDNKVKKCETLDEVRVSYIKLVFIKVSHQTMRKKSTKF